VYPESHLRYHAERHADLLREARNAELAAKLEESRHERRKPLAQRFWRGRFAARFTPSNA
jgi:hypothetical protein